MINLRMKIQQMNKLINKYKIHKLKTKKMQD